MQIDRSIFKAYDIRGIIGEQVTPELAYAIGRGFATLLRDETDGLMRIAVGRDMRPTSVDFQKEVMRGLQDAGCDVIDVGLVSTPAFYFSVDHVDAHGGIMVSASHNPAEYNGFKMTRGKAVPVSGETGIKELADLIEADDFIESDTTGEVEVKEGVPEAFAKMSIAFAGDDPVGEWKIVADSANGMGAQYLDDMFEQLGMEADRMYWEFDGSFPNHEADPFKEKNTQDLSKRIVETGADIGIATDGDGDRIAFLDEKGERLDPAVLRGLISQIVLRDHPGANICYDIRPGKITIDMIEEAGGTPVVTRVGHSLIKEKMREVDAPFAGESSGHFYYRYESGSYDGPVTLAVQLLQELTRRGVKLSDVANEYARYVHSGEINFKVEDKQAMIDKIKAAYPEGELNELDGITITFEDFWFNVRPSNTESKLRLNLEAVDQETMEKRRDEIIGLIEG